VNLNATVVVDLDDSAGPVASRRLVGDGLAARRAAPRQRRRGHMPAVRSLMTGVPPSARAVASPHGQRQRRRWR
jgi:hypothetical protein